MPVEQAEDQELEEEAEWIFKYAFLEQPITHQDVDEQGIPSIDTKQIKPHSTIGKIQEALNLMRNQLFEVSWHWMEGWHTVFHVDVHWINTSNKIS